MTDLVLARGGFDVGILTNHGEELMDFWHRELGLPLERRLEPVPGVVQYKLTLMGAVLKINHVERSLPGSSPISGVRMLLVANPEVDAPTHRRDPDGNLLCWVPPGTNGVDRFGVHLAVSDEGAFHDFYGRVLGFPRISDRSYDVGGATVSFSWSPDAMPVEAASGSGFSYLTLQLADIGSAHAGVCGRGAVEEASPSTAHTTTDATISFICDPDGNRIELSQRPDLAASPRIRLS